MNNGVICKDMEHYFHQLKKSMVMVCHSKK